MDVLTNDRYSCILQLSENQFAFDGDEYNFTYILTNIYDNELILLIVVTKIYF